MLIQCFSEYSDTAHVTQSGESEAFENVALRMRWLRKLGSLNNLAGKRSVKKTDELALVSQNAEKAPNRVLYRILPSQQIFLWLYHHWKQYVVVCEKGRRDSIRIIMIYGPSTIAIYLHMDDIRCSPNALDHRTVGDIVNDVKRKIGPELPFALLCYVATGLWNWIAKP